jgi:hypothetical protein
METSVAPQGLFGDGLSRYPTRIRIEVVADTDASDSVIIDSITPGVAQNIRALLLEADEGGAQLVSCTLHLQEVEHAAIEPDDLPIDEHEVERNKQLDELVEYLQGDDGWSTCLCLPAEQLRDVLAIAIGQWEVGKH